MTPEIKQKIEGKYSDIKCSDTNYRLKAAAEFGYSLASSEIEELKAEVAKYEIDKLVLKELGQKLERSEREVERLKLDKVYEIEFGNRLRAVVKITSDRIIINSAVNGWGNAVPETEIKIIQIV